MNEVDKLYSLAGFEKDWRSLPYGGIEEYYPPFTAEKQIELIKWLVHYIKQINITDAISGEFYFTAFGYVSYLKVDFDEALASFINNLWQSLTEEERKQIKEILE